MAEANVERALLGYEAWGRDDLEGLLALCHPEIEFHTAGVFPGLDPVYWGHAGLRRYWEDFRGPWESLRMDVEEIRESGDRVIALFNFEAFGRGGMRVRRKAANVITYRDGLVVRVDAHGEWIEALAAAGLEA